MEKGVKYGQRTKIVQKWAKTTLRAKWSFHIKNGRSHFLNLWCILRLKDQTLKFLWFWDSFEGVWNENMQKGHFWIILEVHFWQFWPPRGIFRIIKNSCVFWKRLFLEKLTSFDPQNMLNNLLSRNPTLTRRCEVNKFNLVIYFSLQEKCSNHLFIERFSLKFLKRIKRK